MVILFSWLIEGMTSSRPMLWRLNCFPPNDWHFGTLRTLWRRDVNYREKDDHSGAHVGTALPISYNGKRGKKQNDRPVIYSGRQFSIYCVPPNCCTYHYEWVIRHREKEKKKKDKRVHSTRLKCELASYLLACLFWQSTALHCNDAWFWKIPTQHARCTQVTHIM